MFAVLQRYKFESNSQPTDRADGVALLMFAVLQRYKFESNSQHMAITGDLDIRCLLSCKDTNLKAIHNPYDE